MYAPAPLTPVLLINSLSLITVSLAFPVKRSAAPLTPVLLINLVLLIKAPRALTSKTPSTVLFPLLIIVQLFIVQSLALQIITALRVSLNTILLTTVSYATLVSTNLTLDK